ncbi:PaaI family thioesterase [Ruminococcus flavefaciens]|uniref:Acyl-CoA thioesterase n=1 Tax=Ruminococcus flavefaciens TaxID=1265 RepID=A0A315XYJ3_RUMFL|nr:PaaI family thioesterase [Ruminococcus flavefaciens]MBQ6169495.1 PaaI family thioesterase [Ruminococcus sp.]PWJ11621.1 acyl-CoA thioesterase [Ruminococcus flavefaciens]SSA50530.1 acyl-CoA thioesterase [Ruminococcus flavefaciens]
MTDNETLERVRETFRGDRFATEMGAVIDELGDHYSKCSLVLNEHHRNAVGGIMGGVYFTLADFAFAVASNWQQAGVVGLNCDASFIGVPKTERIIAEARLIKDGRTICCYNVDIRDELGNPVAAVQCVGFRKS